MQDSEIRVFKHRLATFVYAVGYCVITSADNLKLLSRKNFKCGNCLSGKRKPTSCLSRLSRRVEFLETAVKNVH